MAIFATETVYLLERVQTGRDNFNAPIFSEAQTPVEGVLIGEPSTDDATETVSLYGKRAAYVLAIPKGDTHTWTDARVQIRGDTYRTIGYPTEGIEANIPLSWNKKVKVERDG